MPRPAAQAAAAAEERAQAAEERAQQPRRRHLRLPLADLDPEARLLNHCQS